MKIVSIDFSRNKGENHMMVFNRGELRQSIKIPSDYSMQDIVKLVLEECNALENVIVCNNRGLGASFYDNLPEKSPNNVKTQIPNYSSQYSKYFCNNNYIKILPRVLNYASNLPAILRLECDKIIDEFTNIDVYIDSASVLRVKEKDEKADYTRLHCLMNALDIVLECV